MFIIIIIISSIYAIYVLMQYCIAILPLSYFFFMAQSSECEWENYNI